MASTVTKPVSNRSWTGTATSKPNSIISKAIPNHPPSITESSKIVAKASATPKTLK